MSTTRSGATKPGTKVCRNFNSGQISSLKGAAGPFGVAFVPVDEFGLKIGK